MRLLKFVLLLALIPVFSYARGGGGHGGGGGGGGHAMGGGGGGFRGGGGSVGGFRGGYGGGYGGGFRGGYGGYYGRGFYGGFGLGLGWGWPYYGYYPYYGYGYPYGSYDYGYQDYNPAYDNSYPAYGNDYGYISGAQAPQSTPPVVIQNYGQPATPAQQQSFYRAPDFYLIAFTDHTIQAAVAFHVQGDQIFWTTREHVEMHAPLSTVDRSFSAQINRDRRVQFNLP